MQMSCCCRRRGRSYNSLCPFTSHTHALKISKPFSQSDDVSDRETHEVTTGHF